MLAELHVVRDEHPLWGGRLFRTLANGGFDRGDLAYIFSQYQLYSKSFTRYLSALMANLESDLFRAQLSQNVWEEGGGCEPARRHAELFRNFLRDGLGVTPEDVEFDAGTQHFVREYLGFCLGNDGLAGSAFLSLGTESIVPRMYVAFVEGLRRAGVAEDRLEFFHLHIACDDDHAETLEQIMLSYADEPRWLDVCKRAMIRALDLRHAFFERLVEGVQQQRVRAIVERINAGVSLAPKVLLPTDVRHTAASDGPPLYANRDDAAGIEFAVTRIPLAAEVLDPRRLEIPPGKSNERHRHAHETFLLCTAGVGIVLVEDRAFEVSPGDSILVPRWALHQTRNTGDVPLQIVAVTDYHLTKRAYVGDAKAYRQDEAANHHRSES
jgi:pyrroloquinoline quinone (PQQ) biosynthesis protein C/mannose-6-phosphate isomerase-like protein (cupin superfamily)